ncbi:pentatricopeptide repeat-containing protein PNM1, mitochondrial-like [Cucurbita pepo subsp. pepo]|uniref:pentatricopeptide repeat-containing protein PNM1, mitochondrial-like n=1 Tax=Cucurbita pepo subsp. pepo TaxID=3664 RepID=UPI000C9D8EA3|nr:pentatricopeptide repeat-containing protein PNM1, mitochondrial-like [Cucurbita pepo subsp. pepo]
MPPLPYLQLRRILIRSLASSSSLSAGSSSNFLNRSARSFLLHRNLTPLIHHFRHHGAAGRLSYPLQLSLSHSFSSESVEDDVDQTSQSLATELLKDPDLDPLPITKRLQLSFSHVKPNPELVLNTLNLSSEAGRTVLGFNEWLVSNPDFHHTDETISYFVDYFGRRKDFNAIYEVLVKGLGISGAKTLRSSIDRFARAGRPTKLISFFETMEKNYGLRRDKESLRMVVEKLCENGFTSHAVKIVKDLANEFFPDEAICDSLIKGWCVNGKLDEAKRLAGEMYRGGFELGTTAYNDLLDCACKLCRKKDPFRLHSEAEEILVEMDYRGVPRNVETFNVLINNLCKIRKTTDAVNLFHRMGEWGCNPNAETFIILTKSLYQAARTGEGDEMIDRMRSAGHDDALDKKTYYEFLNILCGIERIDHALTVFEKMKKEGCEPGIKTYELLIGNLCAHNHLDKANSLFNEAQKRGVPVTPKAYQVDPGYVKKPKVKNVEKKRDTLPEKMARKRRRLKQIRLSFVKKPKKGMRRAF